MMDFARECRLEVGLFLLSGVEDRLLLESERSAVGVVGGWKSWVVSLLLLSVVILGRGSSGSAACSSLCQYLYMFLFLVSGVLNTSTVYCVVTFLCRKARTSVASL